ncbi:valine--tRNA ligase [Sesbania bispinosa]|nr:valine--tRNA ligase [Sesbania bispinosa]
MDKSVEFLYEELRAKMNAKHHVEPAVGIDVDKVPLGLDENFYFSDTNVDENYIPSKGEVDEEGNENLDGEQYEGLSYEE